MDARDLRLPHLLRDGGLALEAEAGSPVGEPVLEAVGLLPLDVLELGVRQVEVAAAHLVVAVLVPAPAVLGGGGAFIYDVCTERGIGCVDSILNRDGLKRVP